MAGPALAMLSRLTHFFDNSNVPDGVITDGLILRSLCRSAIPTASLYEKLDKDEKEDKENKENEGKEKEEKKIKHKHSHSHIHEHKSPDKQFRFEHGEVIHYFYSNRKSSSDPHGCAHCVFMTDRQIIKIDHGRIVSQVYLDDVERVGHERNGPFRYDKIFVMTKHGRETYGIFRSDVVSFFVQKIYEEIKKRRSYVPASSTFTATSNDHERQCIIC